MTHQPRNDSYHQPTPQYEAPGLRSEVSGIETNGISHDDERLLDIMIDPVRRSNLYIELVEETPNSQQKPWQPGLREIAEQGMLDLVKAEFVTSVPSGDTMEDMRKGIWTLNDTPAVKADFARLGRAMSYQNMREPSYLNEGGDWLHFGINRNYAGATDLLPSQMRIYVSPLSEYAGHVAAKVIRGSMEHGYKPNGKVFDDSSNTKGISTRADKLLFVVSTQSQLDMVLSELKEAQAESPNMFADRAPLLAEKTDITGVSLGEEPVNDGSRLQESFTSSREHILETAWDEVVDQFMGAKTAQTGITTIGGRVLDKRVVDLQDAVRRGTVPKDDVLVAFRRSVANRAPTAGISSDNFARNAA